jgi:pseudouridine synthase
VRINKVVAKLGTKLVKGDVLELDGKIVLWEEQSSNTLKPLWQGIDSTKNVYIKLWKPTGSTCTTEPNDERNIFRQTNILQKVTKNRLFPVGRLDKHTTGLIVLTSDTRLVKTLLGAGTKQEKVYQVKLHKNISDEDIQTLSEGIMITTATTTGKVITAMTLPCVVKRMDAM